MTDLLGCVPILVYELLNGFTVDETRVREMIDGRLYFFLFSLKIFKLGMLPRLFVFASIVYQKIDSYIPHVKRIRFENTMATVALTMIFILTCHWFACIWIGFRSDQGSSEVYSYIPIDTTDLTAQEIIT